MNRRHFLSALAASVAGATFDPERALFVPGKKLISIPKPSSSLEVIRFDGIPIEKAAAWVEFHYGHRDLYRHPNGAQVFALFSQHERTNSLLSFVLPDSPSRSNDLFNDPRYPNWDLPDVVVRNRS